MLDHGRYGPASRSTEIWTLLEDDVRCAAWFNSGYTLRRQSTFPPAVNCSAFAPSSSSKFGLSGEMTCTCLVLQSMDTRSCVSLWRCRFHTFFPRQGGTRIPRTMPGAVHTWKTGHYFHGPVCLVFMCFYGGSCRQSLLVRLLFTRQVYLSLGIRVCVIMKFNLAPNCRVLKNPCTMSISCRQQEVNLTLGCSTRERHVPASQSWLRRPSVFGSVKEHVRSVVKKRRPPYCTESTYSSWAEGGIFSGDSTLKNMNLSSACTLDGNFECCCPIVSFTSQSS